jgi:hypothetical protein
MCSFIPFAQETSHLLKLLSMLQWWLPVQQVIAL